MSHEMITLLKSRRSIRSFEDRPIPKDILRTIAETALYAPSAMNRQSWHFVVMTDRAELDALAALVKARLNLDERYRFYHCQALILASNDPIENPMAVDDCACALQNIFLAAHALGVGSVWINQLRHVCDDPEIRAMLTTVGVPTHHTVYGAAALGYERKPPQEKTILPDRITYR